MQAPGGPSTVLRDFAFCYVAPAAQDDSYHPHAMPKITFTNDANAYRITLADPPLNILDIAMLEELRDANSAVKPDRHALIIDAQGDKAFSAGASVQDHLGDRVATMLAHFHDCFRLRAKL